MGKPKWYNRLKDAEKAGPKPKTDQICDEYTQDGLCPEGQFCDRKHVEGETQLSSQITSQYKYKFE